MAATFLLNVLFLKNKEKASRKFFVIHNYKYVKILCNLQQQRKSTKWLPMLLVIDERIDYSVQNLFHQKFQSVVLLQLD